jgi:serine/threonine-protein kinase
MGLFFKEVNTDTEMSRSIVNISRAGDCAYVLASAWDSEGWESDVCRKILDLAVEKQPGLDELLAVVAERVASADIDTLRVAKVVHAGSTIHVETRGMFSLVSLARGSVSEMSAKSRKPGEWGHPLLKWDLDVHAGQQFLLVEEGVDLPRDYSQLSATGLASLKETVDRAASGRPTSVLVFPVDTSFLVKQDWPYDPFVGFQEEFLHEKQGLSLLAQELFQEPTFKGFRIVGGVHIAKAIDSRRPDGVLVTPYGVVLLELKHLMGKVRLPMLTNSKMVQVKKHGEISMANPVFKQRDMQPAFSKNYELNFLSYPSRVGAMVLFTFPGVRVECLGKRGIATQPPCIEADQLVATLSTVVEGLLSLYKKRGVPKPKLTEADIERVCRVLSQETTPRKSSREEDEDGKRGMQLGSYLFDAECDAGLSTRYCKVYRGRHRVATREVIAKEFMPSTLLYSNDDDLSRFGREEVLEILQDIEGVQRYYRTAEANGKVYVILAPPTGEKLDVWLDGDPSRIMRLDMLRLIVKTMNDIKEMAGVDLAHRALCPDNIVVEEGKPVVINFELCRLDFLETLPDQARILFDNPYLAPEVAKPGKEVTSAADVFSLGMLACLLLSGSIPFGSPTERAVFARKPGVWEGLAERCGLNESGLSFLKSMLSNNPKKRPPITGVLQEVSKWN